MQHSHLTFEYNPAKRAVEVYGDREGLRLLMKRIAGLLNKDPGSYIAAAQGTEEKQKETNELANYYIILLKDNAVQ